MSNDHTPETTDATTLTNPQTFQEAWNNGMRNAEIFRLALAENVPMSTIQYLAATQFPERDRSDPVVPTLEGSHAFSWIEIVAHAGWSRAEQKMLLLGVLNETDPNQTDLPSWTHAVFVQNPEAWKLLDTVDEYVRLVEKIVKTHPEVILGWRRHIAYVIGRLNGLVPIEPWSNMWEAEPSEYRAKREAREAEFNAVGMPTALDLARHACQYTDFVSTEAEVDTILALPSETQFKVAMNVAYQKIRLPPSNNPPAHLVAYRLLMHVALSSARHKKDGDIVVTALLDNLSWVPVEVKNDRYGQPARKLLKNEDPERAIRVYRWYLKLMEEVTLPHESWMDQGRFTPESVKANGVFDLEPKFRKALEEAGYRFARVSTGKKPGTNEPRLEAVFEKGPWRYVFIHDTRGTRNEHVRDGMEVILHRPETKPLFSDGRTTGWVTELHPAAPSSDKMLEVYRKTKKI